MGLKRKRRNNAAHWEIECACVFQTGKRAGCFLSIALAVAWPCSWPVTVIIWPVFGNRFWHCIETLVWKLSGVITVFQSPRYNCNGWPGVKHQLTYTALHCRSPSSSPTSLPRGWRRGWSGRTPASRRTFWTTPTCRSGSPCSTASASCTRWCKSAASSAPWAGTSPMSSTPLTTMPACSLCRITSTTWTSKRWVAVVQLAGVFTPLIHPTPRPFIINHCLISVLLSEFVSLP